MGIEGPFAYRRLAGGVADDVVDDVVAELTRAGAVA